MANYIWRKGGEMKLRNKNTGEIIDGGDYLNVYDDLGHQGKSWHYNSLAELNEDWEDYTPKEPLIKDEKVRKAIRAWAEANNFSVFRVNNQHFNYVKIHGVKDRYGTNGSNIEFTGTIAGAEKRTYEITELCGEEEE